MIISMEPTLPLGLIVQSGTASGTCIIPNFANHFALRHELTLNFKNKSSGISSGENPLLGPTSSALNIANLSPILSFPSLIYLIKY